MLRSLSLPLQVDLLLQELKDELCGLSAGTVFMHIMNERIANYGIRHRLENRVEANADGTYPRAIITEEQVKMFREMASDLIRQKQHWKRGTVSYKFAMVKAYLQVSASYIEHDDECIVEG